MRKFVALLMTMMLLASLMLVAATPAAADETPGTVPQSNDQPIVGPLAAVSAASATSLQPVVTETGKIKLSIDAGAETSGGIQVNKPAGATVRSAYLATADVWGSVGGPIPNTAVVLNGVNPTYTSQVSLYTHNAWADVTAIVKPTIDAAPAGLVTISYAENIYLDGSILAVIFNDPAQTVNNTVVLMFGAQNVNGDSFAIGLANPINKADPNLVMDFSLGISFGYQLQNAWGQHSEVDVNSIRMTDYAGGQDDGYSSNSGLITVGGIGDVNTNPLPSGASEGASFRTDDELYNILPFVNTGDTAINVFTRNPSNDDNIFFCALFLGSTIAVVNEGITLGPDTATNMLGETHTVTAKVQDDAGAPVVGRTVTFTVTSGPNAGLTGTAVTNASGIATFSWTSTDPGTDTIVASFIDSKQQVKTSNEVTKIWEEEVDEPCGSQIWKLDSEISGGKPQMDRHGVGGDEVQTGSVVLGASTSQIWLADEAAQANVTFTDGDWMTSLCFKGEDLNNDTFINQADANILGALISVSVGSWDGSVFSAFATSSSGSMSWDDTTNIFRMEVQTQAGSETVLQNDYLALEITNSDQASHELLTEGCSELASPCSDPGYPTPELATVILAGIGLLGLAGWFVFRRRSAAEAA